MHAPASRTPERRQAVMELRRDWDKFEIAHDAALDPADPKYGDFQAAYDSLMAFATKAEATDPTHAYLPEVPDPTVLPSSLIAIANNRASTQAAATLRASGDTSAAAQRGILDTPTKELDPSKTGSEAFVGARKLLADCNNNWNNVRAKYAAGELTHPAGGMQAALDLRAAVVTEVLTQTQEETMADALQHRVKVNEARVAAGLPKLPEGDAANGLLLLRAREAENKRLRAAGQKELPCPPDYPAGVIRPIVWGSAGSQDATSDIDVNLKGDHTEFASQRANEIFRSRFGGADAGMVFDVNFYAMDFMPTINFKALERPKGADASTDRARYDAAVTAKDIAWTMPLTDPACIAAFNANQEHHSQYMIRTYMETPDWDKYRDTQVAAAPASQRANLTARFAGVETSFRQHNQDVANEIGVILKQEHPTVTVPLTVDTTQKGAAAKALNAALKTAFPAMADDDRQVLTDKLVMKAENNLYAKNLNGSGDDTPGQVVPREQSVVALRDKVAILKERLAADPTNADLKTETERAYLDLRKQLSQALTFANEPYLTEASVLHVVVNKQCLTKGIGDGSNLKVSKTKFPLTTKQWMQSVNEQFACCCKELGRHHDLGHALLHGGKYLHRLMNGAKHLEKTTGQAIASPPSQDFLRAMSKTIVTVKKNPRIPDAMKGAEVVRMLQEFCRRNPGQGLDPAAITGHGDGGLQQVLTTFHAAATAAFVKAENGAAPSPRSTSLTIVRPVVAYRTERSLPANPMVAAASPAKDHAIHPVSPAVAATVNRVLAGSSSQAADIPPGPAAALDAAAQKVAAATNQLTALGTLATATHKAAQATQKLTDMASASELSATGTGIPLPTPAASETRQRVLKARVQRLETDLNDYMRTNRHATANLQYQVTVAAKQEALDKARAELGHP